MTDRATVAKMKPRDSMLVSDSLMRKALRSIWRDKLTVIALAVILCLTTVSMLAPFITDVVMRVDPNEPNTADKFTPPLSKGYILGADDIGRDQLARLLHASGVSMGIGFFGSSLALCIGLVFGMVAGYFGGVVDDLCSWIVITIDSIPGLILLILISSILTFNATSLILVAGMIGWIGTYRLIRGQTFSIRSKEYVAAAQALGASPWRIIFIHILPNLISVTVISLALGIAGLILAESALSYLGLGVQPPQATLGNMLTKSIQFFRLGPHLIIFPILLISTTVLCFYIIGDGIRDAFDPALQK
ncbi:MAG: ABC transporter permease [Chloroflexi bacterium]|nr:ABC transporter permease [Chloroflexota bacterium]